MCYIEVYFILADVYIWICFRLDASDKKYMCRYFNDGYKDSNMLVKGVTVEGVTYPVFFAKFDISAGVELTYDYGPGDHIWRGLIKYVLPPTN